jgi:hypothetical protein
MRLAPVSRLLLITAWVGSLWTVGYLVAPTLFMTLADRVLAGTIAGKLFRVEAWVSLVCGCFLLLILRPNSARNIQHATMFKLVGAMVACTLLGYFALQPSMAALRQAAAGNVLDGAARTRFGMLHGIASGVYLIQSLLGIMLVIKNASPSSAVVSVTAERA